MTAISVQALDLRRALTAVLPHTGTDDTLPVLRCVRFEASADGLCLVTTDRYSMAVARIATPGYEESQSWAALLDNTGAQVMRKLLKGTGSGVAALALDEDRLCLTLADSSASWRTVEGVFPAWRPMLHGMLTAAPAHLGDDHGMGAALLARLTVLGGDSPSGKPLGIHVTRGESRRPDGPEPLPVTVVTFGDWFCAALMPARRETPDPAIATWAELTASAETANDPEGHQA